MMELPHSARWFEPQWREKHRKWLREHLTAAQWRRFLAIVEE